jgi:hypothetical protein
MARDSKPLRNGSSRVLYAIYGHGFGSATQSPFRQVDATNHYIIILQYSTIRKSLGIVHLTLYVLIVPATFANVSSRCGSAAGFCLREARCGGFNFNAIHKGTITFWLRVCCVGAGDGNGLRLHDCDCGSARGTLLNTVKVARCCCCCCAARLGVTSCRRQLDLFALRLTVVLVVWA